jgi:biotin carboxylase
MGCWWAIRDSPQIGFVPPSLPLAGGTQQVSKVPKKLLLFAATTGYQIRAFADAARRLGADLTLATDRCHVLEDPWGDQALPVKFDPVSESLESLRGLHFDGVVAVGDRPAALAAKAAKMLEVPFHPPGAARACHDKYLARQLYQAAGLRLPGFFPAPVSEGPRPASRRARYPCVLKPIGLSASRGVIRANDEGEFQAAFERIRALLEKSPDLGGAPEEQKRYLQVEDYIEGREFAIEGLVTEGRFETLAIFDKPDPLEGPFFEETIYVTPSRESEVVQQSLVETAAQAVRALGLWHGPAHIELRFNNSGAWILETAARPIGGLCAKAMRFDLGEGRSVPLEELIIRHALGEKFPGPRFAGPASGVMMIPIPKRGIYESADGVERAAVVPGIEEVIITAKPGQRLMPLPEGASYLGFIFARGDEPGEVEARLRRSHAELRFHIATELETLRT